MVKDIVAQRGNFPKVYLLGKAADADFWLPEKGSYRFKTLDDDGAFKDGCHEPNFIAALCVCCHKAIICLNPIYYCTSVIFPVTSPFVFQNIIFPGYRCQHLINL